MNRPWKGTESKGPLIGAAIVGMVVTFAAGWALAGATGDEVGASSETRSDSPDAVRSPTPTAAWPPVGIPRGIPTGEHSSAATTGTARGADIAAAAGALPSLARIARAPVRPFRCPRSTVQVSTAAELTEALAAARPGASIALAPGVYQGEFVATRDGTPKRPIYLCGPRTSVLDAGAVKGGYALHLNGSSWWRVRGFTVQNAQKGVVLDRVTGVALQGLVVDRIGDEAVHLRTDTTRSVVRGLTIGQTGLRKPKFGEGVYIGTAESNWCKVSACRQDQSNGNYVLDNVFNGTSAEAVDIKEGTSDGVVAGNRFNGTAIRGADSWVDVKGNGWVIANNRGANAPMDGYQVHEIVDGFGYRNLFSGNVSAVDAPGHAIKVTKTRSGNVVLCNNTATGAGQGLTNIECR
jgi:hypothetical protein